SDGTLKIINTSGLKVAGSVALGAAPLDVVVARRPPDSQTGKPPATPTPAVRSTAAPTATILPTSTEVPESARPAEHVPEGVVSEDFLSGADIPVSIAFAPDGRLFYNELKTGKIRVVQNGVLLPDPFYEFAVAGQPETGLLGLALDPAYAQNHYVYVFYTS